MLVIDLAARSPILAAGTHRRDDTDNRCRAILTLPAGENPETYPVRVLRAWLAVSGIVSGPLFRRIVRTAAGRDALSGEAYRVILVAACQRAGLSANWQTTSPHGLRTGFVTQRDLSDVLERAGMAHARQSSTSIYRRYIRERRLPTTALPVSWGCKKEPGTTPAPDSHALQRSLTEYRSE